MRTRRLAVPSLLALLLLVGLAAAVWAQSEEQVLEGKFRAGQRVSVGPDEVVEHDVYATGAAVAVDGTIDGDLIAAAGDVFIRGTVMAALILWLARRPVGDGADRVQRQPLPSLGAGLVGIVAAVAGFIALVLVVAVLAGLLGLVQLDRLAGLVAFGGALGIGVFVLLLIVVLAFVAQWWACGWAVSRRAAAAAGCGPSAPPRSAWPPSCSPDVCGAPTCPTS